MIHHSTLIKWIDVRSQEFHKDSIQKLYQTYSYMEDKNLGRIIFSDSNKIKIKDNTGWTDILSIKKGSNKKWIYIKSFSTLELKVDIEQQIPIYDTQKITKGFHGETLYHYDIIKAEKLIDGNLLRFGNSFTNITFTFSLFQNSSVSEDGYDLFTKSHFFNAGEFYLLNE
jgi:hypothetical protein